MGQPSSCSTIGATTTTTTTSTTTTTLPGEVEGHSPTARFTTSDVVGFVGLPLGFDALYSTDPQNDLVSYDWHFGDGSPVGHAQAMSKIYNDAGTYTVTLVVTDGEGLKDAAQRELQILPADELGLFNAYLRFVTKFNRLKQDVDKLTLDARVNVGDLSVAAGDIVALEIAGERFEAILDARLRATVASNPIQKWRVKFGTLNQAFGEVELRVKITHADLGLGFNQLGALPGGDGEASLSIPLRLEVGTRSFEVPMDSEFTFDAAGTRARGEGSSD